ncbi:MAG TPA: flavin reductase [Caulobacteraceae bacterium]|nr:flavin reductase [Caulobacteraceae bacterium]
MLTNYAYRDAMARLTGAVNIISSDGPAGRAGFTASAVCSVTDDPPMLLVCVNRSSRQDALLQANGVLCVNTLAHQQEPIARAFADSRLSLPQRFAAGDWSAMASGAPALDGALAVFDCRLEQRLEQGTHAVLFCHVLDVRVADGEPLVYFERTFRQLQRP